MSRVSQLIPPKDRLPTYGFTFRASKRFTGVADQATVRMFIDNPQGSGSDLLVSDFSMKATGDAYVDGYGSVTQETSGSSLTIHNRRINNGTSSVATAETGGTYSGLSSDPFIEDVVPGGTKSAGSGSDAIFVDFVIPEGENFLIELTNQSGGVQDYGIRVLWTELTG